MGSLQRWARNGTHPYPDFLLRALADGFASPQQLAAEKELAHGPRSILTTRPVTLRLPRRLIQELRVLAKDRDVPYQSLMKILLAEKVAELRQKAR